MKNTLHNNIRAFRDQIRAEELNREARIVNQDSFYLDLVTPRGEKETLVEPFGFAPFMGLTLE
jgi:ABC-type multidrug transport system fused ATPase/permease subunit